MWIELKTNARIFSEYLKIYNPGELVDPAFPGYRLVDSAITVPHDIHPMQLNVSDDSIRNSSRLNLLSIA
jgi:hypothetical protein